MSDLGTLPTRGPAMPNVNLSKEVYAYLKAFVPVMRATADEDYDVSKAAETLIVYGINESLALLHSAQGSDLLLKIIQQLASRHPEQVFGYMAETMSQGAEIHRQEAAQAWKEQREQTMNIFKPPEA
jgi:hypothetical protein